jgi:hypothetical protein
MEMWYGEQLHILLTGALDAYEWSEAHLIHFPLQRITDIKVVIIGQRI